MHKGPSYPLRGKCVYPDCQNTARKLENWRSQLCEVHCTLRKACPCLPPFKLFLFPQRSCAFRNEWIHIVSTAESWEPGRDSYVCSMHFEDGEPTKAHPCPKPQEQISRRPKKLHLKYVGHMLDPQFELPETSSSENDQNADSSSSLASDVPCSKKPRKTAPGTHESPDLSGLYNSSEDAVQKDADSSFRMLAGCVEVCIDESSEASCEPRVEVGIEGDDENEQTTTSLSISKRKDRQTARLRGKPYVTSSGVLVAAKKVKENQCLKKKCHYNCGEIAEEERSKFFDYYYGLPTHHDQKIFLGKFVKPVPVKRKRNTDSSRRKVTFEYFFGENQERRVCRQFILDTLDISEKYLRLIADSILRPEVVSDEEERGEVPAGAKECASSFIKKLPRVGSHYCKGDLKRICLPQHHVNVKKMYLQYQLYCLEKRVSQPVTEEEFKLIFNAEYDIGEHIPKSKCPDQKNNDCTSDDQVVKPKPPST